MCDSQYFLDFARRFDARLVDEHVRLHRRAHATSIHNADATAQHNVDDTTLHIMNRVLADGHFVSQFFNPEHTRFVHVEALFDFIDLKTNSALRVDNSLLYWAIFWSNTYVVERALRASADPNHTRHGHQAYRDNRAPVHPVFYALLDDENGAKMMQLLLAHDDVDVGDVHVNMYMINPYGAYSRVRQLLRHETFDVHKLRMDDFS